METQNTRPAPTPQRLLVIRRNRMGDMICTVPLLHTLRRQLPETHITVACDRDGASIARACTAVNHVHVLTRGWLSLAMNALRLRGYDAVIAVKGGFDKRLGMLARLTDAPVRIGFHHAAGHRPSKLYTYPIPLPPAQEHQVDTCLRLATPFGSIEGEPSFALTLPDELTAFAHEAIHPRRHAKHRLLTVVNLSCNRAYPLAEKQLVHLLRQLIDDTHSLVALSTLPDEKERARAQKIVHALKSDSVFVLETPSPMHLGAVLSQAGLVITPEGGVGHLAAAFNTPAVILWSEGPFEKWRTRAANHRFVRLDKNPGHRPSTNEIWQSVLEAVQK